MKKTILYNGRVYQSRGHFAQALLIEDGVITAVGSNEDILAQRAGCALIDCQGRTVVPGFNDSHGHLAMVGITRRRVPLLDATSIDEVIRRGQAFLREKPELARDGIWGMGWHVSTFTEGERRKIDRRDLDRVSTDVPVIFSSACGHMLACNSKAIELAGITPDLEIPGGVIEREGGVPTGVFLERARKPILSLIPATTEDALEQAITEAMAYAVSLGITSMQTNDLQTTADPKLVLKAYRSVYEHGKGLLRTHHQVSFPDPEALRAHVREDRADPAFQGDRHTLGPLKLFKDGTLGGRSAMVSQPYLDDPQNFGVEVMSGQEAASWCQTAAELSVPVVTHTIGDRAIEEMLAVYEQYFPDPANPLRNGLIHCQITNHALLRRMADRHIVVYYQPIFLRTDIDAMKGRIAPEIQRESYAFKTYLRMGSPIALGTDSPIEDLDPFANLYCAVARKDKNGLPEGGFYPEERLSIEEAIDGYTIGSSYAQGQEHKKGRLKAGYLADLTVLDRDVFTCGVDEIKGIRPVLTMVGGEVVFGQ